MNALPKSAHRNGARFKNGHLVERPEVTAA